MLSYFDTQTGTYQEARSNAIPINVGANRVITADQAEGTAPQRVQNQLTQWKAGIAHNYEDPDILASQAYGLETWVRSPLWLMALLLPPLAYLALVAVVLGRRRGLANPALRRSKRAHAELMHCLKQINPANPERAYAEVLEAVRAYFAAKLGLSSAALTFEGVCAPLAERGADDALLARVQEIFRDCEAYQYAGQSHAAGVSALIERTLSVASALEKGVLR